MQNGLAFREDAEAKLNLLLPINVINVEMPISFDSLADNPV